MTRLIFLIAYFVTLTLNAQTLDLDIEIGKQALMHSNVTKANTVFKNLSKQHTNNWLPHYYVAQTLITEALMQIENTVLVKQKLEEAQLYLDKAHKLTVKNEEVIIMQAKIYLAYVISNSAVYGRQYSALISKLYNDAYSINPNNPRVILEQAKWNIGAAKYFGSDTSVFCADLEKALKLFDTFKQETKAHPNWGQQDAITALNNCNK